MATPVTILTGHLGSGKTTLLRHVLEHPALRRTALIINEFGEIGIDHLLVAQLAENIVELRGGCICCAVRVDLAMTLRELHEKRQLGEVPAFDHVIVETSGLADPVPILHTLMANPLMHKHYAPDAVVTCVDQLNHERSAAEDPTVLAQLQLADVVLLTKGDLATPAQCRRTVEQVRAANAQGELLQVTLGRADAGAIFLRGLFESGRQRPGAHGLGGWLMAGRPLANVGAHRGPRPDAHVISTDRPVDLAGLGVFLNRVTNTWRDRILRIKGVVNVGVRPRRAPGRGPLIVHAVREKFYPLQWLPEWPDADRRSHLVLIGRDLDRAALDRLFERLCV